MSNPVIRSMRAVCDDATVQDVSIDEWGTYATLRWTQIMGMDRTNVTTLTEVGLKRSSQFYPFRAATPAAAGRSIQCSGEILAPGDFAPTVRFRGATLGDALEVYVAGEVQE